MNIRKEVEKIQELEEKIGDYKEDLRRILLYDTRIQYWESATCNYMGFNNIENRYKRVLIHYILRKIKKLKQQKNKLESELNKISKIKENKMKHKILIIILCIIILLRSVVIFINLKNRYDLNRDGDVNVADSVYLLNYIKSKK